MRATVGRVLVLAGIGLVLAGLVWAGKLPLFRLPGDLRITRGGWVIHLPLATCGLLSAVVSLALYLLR
ncbi:MAG: DUF2905 domain-containing protein [Candidatus Bipolaricaulota bacterium]|nr:DUF2905 domain-containing protein [Candidatus Bipolaricaulota bacterium]